MHVSYLLFITEQPLRVLTRKREETRQGLSRRLSRDQLAQRLLTYEQRKASKHSMRLDADMIGSEGKTVPGPISFGSPPRKKLPGPDRDAGRTGPIFLWR
jgi:hypothetical protein